MNQMTGADTYAGALRTPCRNAQVLLDPVLTAFDFDFELWRPKGAPQLESNSNVCVSVPFRWAG